MGKIPDYDRKQGATMGIVEFDDAKCIRCGACRLPCPSGAVKLPPKVPGETQGKPYIEEYMRGIVPCMACGDCLAACKQGAISIKQSFRINAPYYYERLTQAKEMTFPRKY